MRVAIEMRELSKNSRKQKRDSVLSAKGGQKGELNTEAGNQRIKRRDELRTSIGVESQTACVLEERGRNAHNSWRNDRQLRCADFLTRAVLEQR